MIEDVSKQQVLQVLVLAPTGQDAYLISEELKRSYMQAVPVRDAEQLCKGVNDAAGAMIIAVEALNPRAIKKVTDTLREQEPWSDIPVLILTGKDDTGAATLKILEAFSYSGNVSVIERPCKQVTLIATLKVALNSRLKQFQVKKLLEKQVQDSRTREDFISIASHELRTPITSMMLQAQMHKRSLEKNSPDALSETKVTKFVKTSEVQLRRISRLIEDMLDVSRITSGNLILRRTDFDLVTLVSEVIDRLSPQLSQAECDPQLIAGKPIMGNWDQYRVEQVITNLITNAIRYAPGKPVIIEVFSEDDHAKVYVKDHGIGISEENCKKIFNRFERVGEKNGVSGLGLGLYISRQIIEAHRGSLSVVSKLGEGSIFSFSLPIKQS